MNDEISIADTDTDTKRGDEDIANVLDSSGLNLTEERKNKVVEFLMGMGAVSLDDMRFLTEDDLQGYLLPLQCRRLLHFIKEQLSEQKGLESASTSVQSSNVNRLATVRSNAELDYQLEEDTLPGSILKYLREKIRLPPADRRLLIRMIAADLLSKCSVPGRKLLRNVALKVVLKYPKSLADFGLSGKFLGDGCGSFILQLENCVSNTRRLHKKRPADTSCSSSENEAGNERRKSLNSMHLQNENYSTAAVVPEELESCRNALLTKFQVLDENTSPLDEDTQVLMHKCYSGIRSIINSLQKSVIEIRSEWPILFTKSGFQHHYHHLVGKDFQTFDNNLRKNLSQLLAYMQSLQLKKKKLKLVVKQINDAKQSIGNNQPEILGMLDLLSKYFHEDFEKLVMKVGVVVYAYRIYVTVYSSACTNLILLNCFMKVSTRYI